MQTRPGGITKRVGEYTLFQELGSGSFSTVFKAVHSARPDKVYAVKCISKAKIKGNDKLYNLLRSEVAIMSKINHPNVMKKVDFFETSNSYYIVMPFCNGGDLQRYIDRHGKLSESEAVYFLMQMMSGFQELHKQSVMHRDVKLANMFLDNDVVIIGDFGFCKVANVTETILGTPSTMAPEVISQDSVYTNKADLWSIGVCFYEMIFGKLPFRNPTEQAVFIDKYSGNNMVFSSEVNVSEPCKNLLRGLLQKSPKARIEWNEFFNHPLFSTMKVVVKAPEDEYQQPSSIINKQHLDLVKRDFSRARKEAGEPGMLNLPISPFPPENLKLPEIAQVNEVPQLSPQKSEKQGYSKANTKEIEMIDTDRIREAHKEIFSRIIHERKIFIFIMNGSKKLKELALGHSRLAERSDTMLLASIALSLIGLNKDNKLLSCLENGVNFFNMPEFTSFSASENGKNAINTLKDDKRLYENFIAKLKEVLFKKFPVGSTRNTAEQFINQEKTSPDVEKAFGAYLNSYFPILRKAALESTFEEPLNSQYKLAVAHMGASIKQDYWLSYIFDNKVRLWSQIERQFTLENAEATLKMMASY